MTQTSFDAARDWVGFLFRPLLISGMLTCIAAAWVWFLEFALAPWSGSYLIWIVGAVTLETLLVERQLRRRRLALEETHTWQTRLAEIGMMLLLVKAASYISSGWQGFIRDLSRWAADPATFFNLESVIGTLIVATLWMLSSSIAGNLAEIEDERSWPGEPEAARAKLQEDFMVGAVLLLVAVGAERLALSPAGLSLRPVQLGELAVLPIVYVGLGLLLLGQMRLSLLLAEWNRQQVPVSSGIEHRWAVWSVLFVAGISALVLFLPAGETSLGVYVLDVTISIIFFVAQLLAFLVYLLLSLLFLPFGLLRTQPTQSPRPPQFPKFPPPAETGPMPDWLSSIQTVILGVLIVLMVFLIVRTYWRDRRASGIWKTIGDLLGAAWNGLLAWLRGSTRRVQQILRRAPAPRGVESPGLTLAWWRAWRAPTARERVRRLYLALLERVAPRRPRLNIRPISSSTWKTLRGSRH